MYECLPDLYGKFDLVPMYHVKKNYKKIHKETRHRTDFEANLYVYMHVHVHVGADTGDCFCL